jgi:hypothetical protein
LGAAVRFKEAIMDARQINDHSAKINQQTKRRLTRASRQDSEFARAHVLQRFRRELQDLADETS